MRSFFAICCAMNIKCFEKKRHVTCLSDHHTGSLAQNVVVFPNSHSFDAGFTLGSFCTSRLCHDYQNHRIWCIVRTTPGSRHLRTGKLSSGVAGANTSSREQKNQKKHGTGRLHSVAQKNKLFSECYQNFDVISITCASET